MLIESIRFKPVLLCLIFLWNLPICLSQSNTIIPDINSSGKYALVRKDEKGNKTTVTDYQYEFINEGWTVPGKSGSQRLYFSCLQNGKWGVLNQDGGYHIQLQELDTLWMLRSRDAFKLVHNDETYDYYNVDGELIAAGIVSEKRSPYARYRVLTKKDGTQSIIHQGKEVVKPIPYELDLQIQNLARTFLVKNKQGYYIINLDGLPLNEKPYEAALPVDFNGNLAVRENGKWRILDKNLKAVDDKWYSRITRKESEFGKRYFYLCYDSSESDAYVYAGDYPTLVSPDPVQDFTVEKSFGLGRRNGKWAILIPEKLKFGEFKYDKFDRIARNEAYYHLIYCTINGYYTVTDEEGNEYYASLNLEKVRPLTCEVGARLVLQKEGKIAIVGDPAQEPDPSFIYEDAVCADKGYYLKKDGKWGMMDNTGKVVVEFTYSDYREINQ